MSNFQLPFQPIRSTLYTPDELFAGFDLNDPRTFSVTPDFLIYQSFVAGGGSNAGDYLTTLMQSLHDNSITQALRSALATKKRVATMGGHDMARTDAAYRQIAELARALTRAGFMVVSGGGPGAMEATHLGAACANSTDTVLSSALELLSARPTLPKNLDKMVDANGTPDPAIVAEAHAWFSVAIKATELIANRAASVALPTWRYGQEPTTPFACEIAKYFQNSIREDGLVAVGTHGVIFAPGKAGTIQEIFQSTTNNYYLQFGTFSPMVFLGVQYWTHQYPVMAVLQRLFKPEQIKTSVLVTDEWQQVVEFIRSSPIKPIRLPIPSFSSVSRTRLPSVTNDEPPGD